MKPVGMRFHYFLICNALEGERDLNICQYRSFVFPVFTSGVRCS